MILTWEGNLTPISLSPSDKCDKAQSSQWCSSQLNPAQIKRSASAELLPTSVPTKNCQYDDLNHIRLTKRSAGETRSSVMTIGMSSKHLESPPLPGTDEAVNRAISLSKKLSSSNIPTLVTDTGDLMLDMTGFKSSEDEALRAEAIARKSLAEELEENYDIGALIGADEQGNLWIYSSEEAKEAAEHKIRFGGLAPVTILGGSVSDLGIHGDEESGIASHQVRDRHQRTQSDATPGGIATPPNLTSSIISSSGDPNRNYAKTLRLTSDQLKALKLKSGANTMSFSVNRAICQASMYFWTYDVPIVISDIDGTITK